MGGKRTLHKAKELLRRASAYRDEHPLHFTVFYNSIAYPEGQAFLSFNPSMNHPGSAMGTLLDLGVAGCTPQQAYMDGEGTDAESLVAQFVLSQLPETSCLMIVADEVATKRFTEGKSWKTRLKHELTTAQGVAGPCHQRLTQVALDIALESKDSYQVKAEVLYGPLTTTSMSLQEVLQDMALPHTCKFSLLSQRSLSKGLKEYKRVRGRLQASLMEETAKADKYKKQVEEAKKRIQQVVEEINAGGGKWLRVRLSSQEFAQMLSQAPPTPATSPTTFATKCLRLLREFAEDYRMAEWDDVLWLKVMDLSLLKGWLLRSKGMRNVTNLPSNMSGGLRDMAQSAANILQCSKPPIIPKRGYWGCLVWLELNKWSLSKCVKDKKGHWTIPDLLDEGGELDDELVQVVELSVSLEQEVLSHLRGVKARSLPTTWVEESRAVARVLVVDHLLGPVTELLLLKKGLKLKGRKALPVADGEPAGSTERSKAPVDQRTSAAKEDIGPKAVQMATLKRPPRIIPNTTTVVGIGKLFEPWKGLGHDIPTQLLYVKKLTVASHGDIALLFNGKENPGWDRQVWMHWMCVTVIIWSVAEAGPLPPACHNTKHPIHKMLKEACDAISRAKPESVVQERHWGMLIWVAVMNAISLVVRDRKSRDLGTLELMLDVLQDLTTLSSSLTNMLMDEVKKSGEGRMSWADDGISTANVVVQRELIGRLKAHMDATFERMANRRGTPRRKSPQSKSSGSSGKGTEGATKGKGLLTPPPCEPGTHHGLPAEQLDNSPRGEPGNSFHPSCKAASGGRVDHSNTSCEEGGVEQQSAAPGTHPPAVVPQQALDFHEGGQRDHHPESNTPQGLGLTKEEESLALAAGIPLGALHDVYQYSPRMSTEDVQALLEQLAGLSRTCLSVVVSKLKSQTWPEGFWAFAFRWVVNWTALANRINGRGDFGLCWDVMGLCIGPQGNSLLQKLDKHSEAKLKGGYWGSLVWMEVTQKLPEDLRPVGWAQQHTVLEEWLRSGPQRPRPSDIRKDRALLTKWWERCAPPSLRAHDPVHSGVAQEKVMVGAVSGEAASLDHERACSSDHDRGEAGVTSAASSPSTVHLVATNGGLIRGLSEVVLTEDCNDVDKEALPLADNGNAMSADRHAGCEMPHGTAKTLGDGGSAVPTPKHVEKDRRCRSPDVSSKERKKWNEEGPRGSFMRKTPRCCCRPGGHVSDLKCEEGGSIAPGHRWIRLRCTSGCELLLHFPNCWRQYDKKLRGVVAGYGGLTKGQLVGCLTESCCGFIVIAETGEGVPGLQERALHELYTMPSALMKEAEEREKEVELKRKARLHRACNEGRASAGSAPGCKSPAAGKRGQPTGQTKHKTGVNQLAKAAHPPAKRTDSTSSLVSQDSQKVSLSKPTACGIKVLKKVPDKGIMAVKQTACRASGPSKAGPSPLANPLQHAASSHSVGLPPPTSVPSCSYGQSYAAAARRSLVPSAIPWPGHQHNGNQMMVCPMSPGEFNHGWGRGSEYMHMWQTPRYLPGPQEVGAPTCMDLTGLEGLDEVDDELAMLGFMGTSPEANNCPDYGPFEDEENESTSWLQDSTSLQEYGLSECGWDTQEYSMAESWAHMYAMGDEHSMASSCYSTWGTPSFPSYPSSASQCQGCPSRSSPVSLRRGTGLSPDARPFIPSGRPSPEQRGPGPNHELEGEEGALRTNQIMEDQLEIAVTRQSDECQEVFNPPSYGNTMWPDSTTSDKPGTPLLEPPPPTGLTTTGQTTPGANSSFLVDSVEDKLWLPSPLPSGEAHEEEDLVEELDEHLQWMQSTMALLCGEASPCEGCLPDDEEGEVHLGPWKWHSGHLREARVPCALLSPWAANEQEPVLDDDKHEPPWRGTDELGVLGLDTPLMQLDASLWGNPKSRENGSCSRERGERSTEAEVGSEQVEISSSLTRVADGHGAAGPPFLSPVLHPCLDEVVGMALPQDPKDLMAVVKRQILQGVTAGTERVIGEMGPEDVISLLQAAGQRAEEGTTVASLTLLDALFSSIRVSLAGMKVPWPSAAIELSSMKEPPLSLSARGNPSGGQSGILAEDTSFSPERSCSGAVPVTCLTEASTHDSSVPFAGPPQLPAVVARTEASLERLRALQCPASRYPPQVPCHRGLMGECVLDDEPQGHELLIREDTDRSYCPLATRGLQMVEVTDFEAQHEFDWSTAIPVPVPVE